MGGLHQCLAGMRARGVGFCAAESGTEPGRATEKSRHQKDDGRRRLPTHRLPPPQSEAQSAAGEGRPLGQRPGLPRPASRRLLPTPPRGTLALLARESFKGVLWECACGDGAVSAILEAARFDVISTDLVDRGYGRGGHDFLTDNATLVDHVITNPPYGPARGLSARFVEHALTRIRPGGTVCMLLRTNWEAPQAHRHLMARCCRKYTFSRRLEMHRGGYTGKKHSPQLDVSWYVFSNEHFGPTQTEILPRDCGDEATKFDTPTIAVTSREAA